MNPAKSHAHEILPNLWLGDITASQDVNFHNYYKIDTIFNCTKDLPFIPSHKIKHTQKHYRIPVHDNLQKEEIIALGNLSFEAITHLDKQLSKNKKVLVHCYAGAQRSAALVTMYVIYKYKIKPEKAIQKVKSIRPQAFPRSINFKDAIYFFYDTLKGYKYIQ